jgi:phage shock protein C
MTAAARFLRSSDDRVIAGICGGIGDYFGWSATRVRAGYVLLSVLSAAFPGLLVYLILWFVVPSRRPAPASYDDA